MVTGSTGFLSPLPPLTAPPRSPSSMPSPPASGARSDPHAILAPVAGTVQKVYVQAGSRVEAKAPVVLLDAMKMDTYIYAPRAGELSEVCVKPGDGVQVGDCLIRYTREA